MILIFALKCRLGLWDQCETDFFSAKGLTPVLFFSELTPFLIRPHLFLQLQSHLTLTCPHTCPSPSNEEVLKLWAEVGVVDGDWDDDRFCLNHSVIVVWPTPLVSLSTQTEDSCQNKCWQYAFLLTTDMLKLLSCSNLKKYLIFMSYVYRCEQISGLQKR